MVTESGFCDSNLVLLYCSQVHNQSVILKFGALRSNSSDWSGICQVKKSLAQLVNSWLLSLLVRKGQV